MWQELPAGFSNTARANAAPFRVAWTCSYMQAVQARRATAQARVELSHAYAQ